MIALINNQYVEVPNEEPVPEPIQPPTAVPTIEELAEDVNTALVAVMQLSIE